MPHPTRLAAVLVAGLVVAFVLVLPDVALAAGRLNEIGENMQSILTQFVGAILGVIIAIGFTIALGSRQYPAMVVLFFAACFCAYMVLAPQSALATLKEIGMDFMGVVRVGV